GNTGLDRDRADSGGVGQADHAGARSRGHHSDDPDRDGRCRRRGLYSAGPPGIARRRLHLVHHRRDHRGDHPACYLPFDRGQQDDL
ncbi:MAG: Transglycosylase associated protein, partial [uncultured Rubrobacteraceae bacterium]